MESIKLRKLITAGLMAALCCVATYAIHIPIPNGYIHPGDAFVLLSGIILGPIYGGLAAGIGSMFADIIIAYPYYWVTLIVKGLAAAACVLLYRKLHVKYAILFAAILGEVIVTAGYFLFEIPVYGMKAATLDITFNLIQNAFGIILTCILYPLLNNVPQIREMMKKTRNH